MTQLDDEHEKLLGARGKQESGGARTGGRNNSRYPWLSNLLLGILAVVIPSSAAWVVSQLNENTRTNVQLIERVGFIAQIQAKSDQRTEARDDAQDSRLNTLENRVSVIEGRTFRGVQGYGEPHGR